LKKNEWGVGKPSDKRRREWKIPRTSKGVCAGRGTKKEKNIVEERRYTPLGHIGSKG